MTSDLDELRERYISERPRYEEVARCVERYIEQVAKELRVPARGEARAKEVPSLLKKLLKKQDESDPYEAIGDKAGARLTLRYRSDATRLADALEERLDVLRREDKAAVLDFSELGYLGIHLEIAVGEKTRASIAEDVTHLADLRCEVQLRTNAESAWAEVSHELLYKAVMDVPSVVKRAIYRLVALVELFDESVQTSRSTIMSTAEYAPALLVSGLSEAALEFTTVPGNTDLSWDVVEALSPLYDVEPPAIVSERIAPFVTAQRAKLTGLFDAYREDERANPFLSQPEVLMIFERMAVDRHALRSAWPRTVPVELLDGLAEVWGEPY